MQCRHIVRNDRRCSTLRWQIKQPRRKNMTTGSGGVLKKGEKNASGICVSGLATDGRVGGPTTAVGS